MAHEPLDDADEIIQRWKDVISYFENNSKFKDFDTKIFNADDLFYIKNYIKEIERENDE